MAVKVKKPLPRPMGFRARINHSETLKFMITNPVRGFDGLFIALREAINNSIDAGASEIAISLSTYEGKPALVISDNGNGFNRAGITSAMSYAFSSRKREDYSTIGTNGTGIKSFLGLGKLEKTKLTILTVNKELSGCTKMEITFEYLLGLAKKKVKADDYISSIDEPSDWAVDMKRTSGSTLILTGFDGRKIKTAVQMITQLGEYMTPRAYRFIKIKNGLHWNNITPVVFPGHKFEFPFKSDTLGAVEMALYYGGGTSGEGPIVCGSINAIIPLTDLYSRMSKEQKGKVSKVWKVTSGHIYLEKANTFRVHDGSFSDDFYESKACEELITLLGMVAQELEKLADEARDEAQLKKKQHLIEQIIRIGKELSTPPPLNIHTNGGNMPGESMISDSDQDYYILPKGIRMSPGQVETITLVNRGRKPVNFTETVWSTASDLISILEVKEGSAVVKANNVGTAALIADGEFGQHIVTVDITVVSIKPFISGPSYIKPGGTYPFELKRYEKDALLWQIERSPSGVLGTAESGQNKTFSLTVDANCADCEFTLLVRSKGSERLIAQKTIYVLEAGARKKAPIIRIAKRDYILSSSAYFPETVAQVDYLFHESPLPEIVVNPIHPRIKNMGYMQSMDHILAAIANAAIIDQVAESVVKPSEAQTLVEQFIAVMKENLLLKSDKKE